MNSRMIAVALVAGAAFLGMSAAQAQLSTGRGARDPQPAQLIVGSEGKGLFTSAGVPPDNMPIFAARDRVDCKLKSHMPRHSSVEAPGRPIVSNKNVP